MGAWSKAKPASWAAKGRLFRQRMAAAGYDRPATRGRSTSSRARPHEAGHPGAQRATRCAGSTPGRAEPAAARGRVRRRNRTAARQLRPVQGPARGLARRTAAWWTAVSPYVAWWSQEAYASCSQRVRRRSEGRDPLDASQRVRRASGAARIRRAGTRGSSASALRPRVLPADDGVLARRKGYGNNRVSLAQMQALTNLEVYAARAWAIRNPYPDGRIGFAWNEHPAGRDARSGAGARDAARTVDLRAPTATEARRRRPAARPGRTRGARPTSAARRFNPGWATFASW